MCHRPLALLAPFLLLLAACGSSGGTTVVAGGGLVDPNTLFTGAYGFTWLEARPDVPDVVGTRWGSITGDGAGGTFLEYEENQDGTLSAPPPTAELDYTVQLDRVFGWGTLLPGSSIFRGAISDNGDVACVTTALSPFQAAIVIATRRAGVHDDGSLIGAYFYVSYSATAGAGFNVAGWGSVDFDGAGGAAFVTNQNFEGALAGPNPVAGTYAVAADGQFTMSVGAGPVMEGSIGAGGEVLTAGGGTLAGDDPTCYVFLRRGMGYADADLDGPWHMNGFLHEFLANDYAAMHGGAVKNEGVPDLTYLGLLNKNGAMEGVPFSPALIQIDAGGNVSLEIAPGIFLRGGMSRDRRFMMLGGSDQPGSDPGFFFFIR